MGNHKPRVIRVEDGWVSRCTCRWRGTQSFDSPQQAEDANLAHLRDIEKVRARVASRPPTLRQVRDNYLKLADDPATDPDHRELWRRLADEISARLNESGTDTSHQGTLW